MIAITGASGQLGRLVIDALLQRLPASEIILGDWSPHEADRDALQYVVGSLGSAVVL